jgi:hypothetical protein
VSFHSAGDVYGVFLLIGGVGYRTMFENTRRRNCDVKSKRSSLKNVPGGCRPYLCNLQYSSGCP